MTDLKKASKDFQTLNGYPLKSIKRTKSFVDSVDIKTSFLKSVEEFSKKYPNINYFELGEEIGKTEKGNFQGRYKGLIEFMNRPQDIEGLKKMLKGVNDKKELILKLQNNFNPSDFPPTGDAGERPLYMYDPISTSEIAGVVSKKKLRGSKEEKELKEEKEAKERAEQREDITQRVEKVKMDDEGNVFESEDDPRVVKEDEEEEESKEDERPPATAIPATISPDERDAELIKKGESLLNEMKEEIKAEQDQKKKEILEQELKAQQAQQAEAKRQSDIATMTLGKGSATGKVEEMAIQDIPQDIRAIPKERASTTGKSEAQLKDDINYFFKTYPDMLKKEKGQYMIILRGKSPALRKKQLIELHRRIVGLVGNVEDLSKDIGKQIGIILNADKYLDDKINAILLDKITQGLTPASLVVDVTDKTKDDKSKRVGSYQITKGRSGLLNAQKAPVYRSIPTTNDSQDRRSNRPIKLKTLPTQRWDEVNTAKKQMRLDPFEPKREKVNRFDIYL